MELRIGNFVMDKYANMIEVEEIQGDRINCFEGDPEFQTLLKDVFPISLESYLLLLFGFSMKEHEGYTSYKKHRFEIVVSKKTGTCLYIAGESESITIDSIHKLQNTYKMIMDEDLTISELKLQQAYKKHIIDRNIALRISKQN